MPDVKAIEEALKVYASHDLAAFLHWFAGFDSASWDCQIERDLTNGRLNDLLAEAVADQ